MVCEHLFVVEKYIRQFGIAEYWRGQPWTQNCREWVYFDCILAPEEIKKKLNLDPCVEVFDYFDVKAGAELGLVCKTCNDGVMGWHPKTSSSGKTLIS